MNKLIIQSDQMHTGASRAYNSSRSSYVRHSAWDASGNMLYYNESAEHARTSSYSKSFNGMPAACRFPANGKEDESDTGADGSAVGSGGKNMKELMEQMNASSPGIRKLSVSEAVSNLQKLRQDTLNYLFNILFRRKDRFPAADRQTGSATDLLSSDSSGLYGAGESYYSSFYYSEHETTCFNAKGTAVTADGRKIPFSVNLEMSRSFTQIAQESIEIGKPRLCDPLVINLAGNGAGVTDQKFFFDLDADGEKEEISSLASGSGYLALDKNGDGEINDGSELFGTASGNGFADLAAYDADGNGWIDEADEIFSRLRIWVRNADGTSKLLTLKETGVGAICLGSENTEFSLNSLEDNHTNAVVRKTGIFLYENGGCGTVQQLDLAT